MKKKRLLYLVQLPPPIHGVTMMNQYLCDSSYLQDHFDVRVLPLNFSKSLLDIEKFNFSKLAHFFEFLARMIKTLLFFKPQLVYFTFSPRGLAFYRDLIFLFIIRLFKCKVLLHLHGQGIRQAAEKSWKRVVCNFCFGKNKFITQSPYLYEDVRPLVDERQVYYIVNGIPQELTNEEFAAIIQKRLEHQLKPQILFLSNIISTKGPMFLLEALAKLKKEGKVFKAFFSGYAKDQAYLRVFLNAIKEYGLVGDVEYIGPADSHLKKKLFAESHIFVHPTFFDAFPLVLLEALQYGLPVISTYEGGIPDIVDHEQIGYLINKGDVDQLVFYLRKLIEDPQLRISLGRKSREKFVQCFTLAPYEQRIAEAISQCVK